jgi:alpha-beta hydrolase superfamily lysophospholipase
MQHHTRCYFSPRYLVCLLLALSLNIYGCSGPQLQPWHKAKLTEEFTVDNAEDVSSFDDYLQLEERLLDQLSKKVYAKTETGAGFELARYSAGSIADPSRRDPNWNRSYELKSDTPAGGVLLLHGMSDSPYSLRALGETFNEKNYWVVGPRLPGHGTAPSGLKHIQWEDMAAVVDLCMAHLAKKVGNKPIHIIGYSNGAPLALDYTLNALEESAAPTPASLVLISPAIGIHPMAGLSGLKDGLSIIPGLGHMAWVSIEPEFDPYKYNSFATNAGTQVHRVTRNVAGRIAARAQTGGLEGFPPVLAIKSTVDATVSTNAVIDRLLRPLGPHGHELILFDINRLAAQAPLLVSDPGPLTASLMNSGTLPFAVTLVTNESSQTAMVQAKYKPPFNTEVSTSAPLGDAWPTGVISLSHVALPFPPDDPLYGRTRSKNMKEIYLGQIAIKGERGLLKISSDWLLRLRYNPFYEYMERRIVEWFNGNDDLSHQG